MAKSFRSCSDENGNHEYSAYYNAEVGRTVCFTCDPTGENLRHSPILRMANRAIFGGWTLATREETDELYIEGRPSAFFREKPSENGNGWWAGDKLVHEFETEQEAAEAFKLARRRLEDRVRKDPKALKKALTAVFG